MNVLVFMLVVLMPNGDIHVDTQQVTSCPDKQRFTQAMDAQVAHGDIASWQAICEVVVLPFTAS